MAKTHEDRVYIVPCHTGDRYVIARAVGHAREHVIRDFVGTPRKASAIEVATAITRGVRIETVAVEGGDDE